MIRRDSLRAAVLLAAASGPARSRGGRAFACRIRPGCQWHRPRCRRQSAAKLAAVSSVERHAQELAELSDRIWAYAEIALREHRSAAALADYAERQGFRVQRGVAGHAYGVRRPLRHRGVR